MRPIDALKAELLRLSAAEAAELFISPHIAPKLLCEATDEPGPAIWVVNRSDVYDATLLALKEHPIPGIAERAAQKYQSRYFSLNMLDAPEDPGPVHEIPDYAVDEVLGHPLVSFDAILFFSKALNEDHRATACLSLPRRLVEYPVKWESELGLKIKLIDTFASLLNDSSPFVRSYAARIPIFPSNLIAAAWSTERNVQVATRLLQNPETPPTLLSLPLHDMLTENLNLRRVRAFDARLPREFREAELLKESDPIARGAHSWYLANFV